MSETPEKGETASGGEKTTAQRVIIKKYANRRLYNTASSSYVTLEHLSDMVKQGVDFVVYDAKSNDDITRSVLTQIIFEEENRGGGQNLLPIQFLRQLIGFYGNSMQAFLPSYLEMSLESFTKQQERMRGQFAGLAPGKIPGMGVYEEQIRQNMALFDRAMKMFSPFAYVRPEDAAAAVQAEPAPAPAAASAGDDSLADLKRQMEAMQEQLAKLANKP
jgi:polyhydroxyalkanoate synthesis repressor PhaR